MEKPKRNWRGFLKEYAIIVVGVLTALAAQQAVDWWQWQHRVADARAAMLLELRDDIAPQTYVRVAAMNCFDRQLDAIQTAIESDRGRKEITGLIDQYTPPRRTWTTNAWDSILASDVSSHISPDQMITWGNIYSALPRARAAAEQESAELIALRPIRRNGDKLSASEAETMLTSLVRLRAVNRRFGEGANGFLGILEQNGISLAAQQKNTILAQIRARYPNCTIVPPTMRPFPNEQIDQSRNAPENGER